jgi:hypothetical protein
VENHRRILIGLIFACPLSAIAATPNCPATLSVIQTPEKIPDGFTVYADASAPAKMPPHAETLKLESIMFSEGPPEEQGWLAPDTTEELVSRWDFAAAKIDTAYFSCTYESTSLIVSRPLPAGTKSCTVQTAKDDAAAPQLQCDTP